jgi:hypothetical protein
MLRGKHKMKAINGAMEPGHQATFTNEGEGHTTLYDEKVRLLTARYYYHNNNLKNYEQALVALAKEFFISTGRIADIIAGQIPTLQALRKMAPKKAWFKSNWGHMVW